MLEGLKTLTISDNNGLAFILGRFQFLDTFFHSTAWTALL